MDMKTPEGLYTVESFKDVVTGTRPANLYQIMEDGTRRVCIPMREGSVWDSFKLAYLVFTGQAEAVLRNDLD
jgi:hypothetical protein